MLNFLKSFFDRYFYDDEHYAALFILSIGIVILYFIGGIIAPPDEAAASTPPANTLENPRFIIIGIVKTPVDKTLTTGPPVIVPNIADDTIAA